MFHAFRLARGTARFVALAVAAVVVLSAVLVAVPRLRVGAAVAAASPDANVWVSCTPANVAVFAERVHVKCTAAVSGIWYFAVSTQNPASAARFLSVMSTAQAAGRTLSIWYNPSDTSGAAWGCQSSDCRAMQAVAFGP